MFHWKVGKKEPKREHEGREFNEKGRRKQTISIARYRFKQYLEIMKKKMRLPQKILEGSNIMCWIN